jgi:hypothetical protein
LFSGGGGGGGGGGGTNSLMSSLSSFDLSHSENLEGEEVGEGLHFVELFDRLMTKLMELGDVEESDTTNNIVRQLSSELIESEKKCMEFKNNL